MNEANMKINLPPIILLGLSIVFNIVSIILEIREAYYPFRQVLFFIFTIIQTAIFITSIITLKKELFIVYYIIGIVMNGINIIIFIFIRAGFIGGRYATSIEFSGLSAIALNAGFILFLLWLFKNMDITPKDNAMLFGNMPNTYSETNMDVFERLQGYKELLDMGAITKEEFEEKKKEIL